MMTIGRASARVGPFDPAPRRARRTWWERRRTASRRRANPKGARGRSCGSPGRQRIGGRKGRAGSRRGASRSAPGVLLLAGASSRRSAATAGTTTGCETQQPQRCSVTPQPCSGSECPSPGAVAAVTVGSPRAGTPAAAVAGPRPGSSPCRTMMRTMRRMPPQCSGPDRSESSHQAPNASGVPAPAVEEPAVVRALPGVTDWKLEQGLQSSAGAVTVAQ